MADYSMQVSFNPSIALLEVQFENLAKNIKSFKVPLDRMIREVMIPHIQNQFQTDGQGSWKPLAEFTVNKKGFDDILLETGKLEKEARFIKNWTVNGPAGTATLDNLNQSVGYGYYHQTGFTNWVTGKVTAARPWINPGEDELSKCIEVLASWFSERTGETIEITFV